MQITFDPLNAQEAEAVAKFLNRENDVIRLVTSGDQSVSHFGTMVLVGGGGGGGIDSPGGSSAPQVIAEADRPDVGALAPSAVPLPPAAAPLPAAATLFSTAPEAPQDGQAATTPVPPPPVPTAPVPAVPPAPAPAAPRAENGELDKDGLPWDARIHSGSRVKNADGTWRQRRGVNDPAMVKRVEEELRALMLLSTRPNVTTGGDDPLDRAASTATAPATSTDGTANGAADVPAPPVATEGNVPPPPVPAPPTSAPTTAPIPTPPVPPAPTAAAPSAPVTFAELMRMCMKGVTERTFTEASVHEILGRHGLAAGEMGKLASADMNETMQKVATDVRALLGDA